MKKFVVFLIAMFAILAVFSGMYSVNKANTRIAKQQNEMFEEYYQKKVTGTEVATIINKAMDNNNKNHVLLDEQNNYIENEKNSIKINVKMLDNDTVYPMEVLARGGMEKFVEYYNMIQFECVDIQYHSESKKVKSLLFEQITV